MIDPGVWGEGNEDHQGLNARIQGLTQAYDLLIPTPPPAVCLKRSWRHWDSQGTMKRWQLSPPCGDFGEGLISRDYFRFLSLQKMSMLKS